jgi:hypothetical protein
MRQTDRKPQIVLNISFPVKLNTCMQQSPPSEPISLSASHEIPCLVGDSTARCGIHQGPPLTPVYSDHIPMYYLFKLDFNIILLSSKSSLYVRLSNETHECTCHVIYMLHIQPISSCTAPKYAPSFSTLSISLFHTRISLPVFYSQTPSTQGRGSSLVDISLSYTNIPPSILLSNTLNPRTRILTRRYISFKQK